MNFWEHIKLLERKLREHDPPEFSSLWLLKYAPATYRFISKNVRTEIDEIDWDRVTAALPRRYQKRWMRYRRTARTPYENRDEFEKVLGKYRDNLYVFIASSSPEEEQLRHKITVALVRLSQRGNVLATRELVNLLRFVVDEWMDRYFSLRRWRGAESEIDGAIEGCIRRYRYTGTFFGYLFKTLEYSAYGLKPLHSLDECLPGTDMRRAEVVGQDPESGETKVYGQLAFIR
jgi:hypothetical protein